MISITVNGETHEKLIEPLRKLLDALLVGEHTNELETVLLKLTLAEMNELVARYEAECEPIRDYLLREFNESRLSDVPLYHFPEIAEYLEGWLDGDEA